MKYKIAAEFVGDEEFLLSIREQFEGNDKSIHKARNEIKIIDFKGVKYVVKSFKVPHIINKIAYTFFRASKASKSYENALIVGDFTPNPFGYIEFFKGGLFDKSFYISEAYDYDFTIREPFADENFPDKERILKEFAKFSFLLHEREIYHKDFSPGNILIKKIDDSYEFKIVDINRMVFIPLDMEDRAKSFSKLWAKDEVLLIIAEEYASLAKFDKETFSQKALFHSEAHKKKKEFYKRMKGKS